MPGKLAVLVPCLSQNMGTMDEFLGACFARKRSPRMTEWWHSAHGARTPGDRGAGGRISVRPRAASGRMDMAKQTFDSRATTLSSLEEQHQSLKKQLAYLERR